MIIMKSTEIRSTFIEFFKSKGHTFVPGSPVIPQNDPTLLFINAGMNQFKDVFLGQGIRDYTRAVNSQVCIRVSGKHNDLEEVGLDTHHLTLFEMLGNWSFGDYYKKEAITWAWELFTEYFKLPKDKLYASIYLTDHESGQLWKKLTDIDPSHILPFEKENFWEMAETGPCGPCSEIHLDRGPDTCDKTHIAGHVCRVNGDCARYIELWNLVFIQYNRQSDGSLIELPNKHVDTGAGLERLTAYLQGTTSSYETDLFTPIIHQIESLSGLAYQGDTSGMPFRVMADHVRTLTFALADNVMPSNEGRGYVLRRLLRRALRYAKKLNINEPIIYKLSNTLIDTMGHFYDHLEKRRSFITTMIKSEEESFLRTLESGIIHFENIISQLREKNISKIPGEAAFKLYDTYGFPIDLTQLMAQENGMGVDIDGFQIELEKQREQSRKHLKLHHADDERASRGGEARVVSSDIDRLNLARHHSATHLLQAALRKVLGEHVHQAGSLVDVDYLRFDFTHFQPLSDDELAKVEGLINDTIKQSLPVDVIQTDLEKAKEIGALALFGEKYDKMVRVIKMGDVSMELCGGNHVGNTGEIEQVKILSESAISAGTRRIVAMAGLDTISQHDEKQAKEAMDRIESKCQLFQKLLTQIQDLGDSIEAIPPINHSNLDAYYHLLSERIKSAEKQLKTLKQQSASRHIHNLIAKIQKKNNISYLLTVIDDVDMENLKTMADQLTANLQDYILVLGSITGEKAVVVAKVAKSVTSRVSAQQIIKTITQIAGGNGGGKPEFAQAGNISATQLLLALNTVKQTIET